MKNKKTDSNPIKTKKQKIRLLKIYTKMTKCAKYTAHIVIIYILKMYKRLNDLRLVFQHIQDFTVSKFYFCKNH